MRRNEKRTKVRAAKQGTAVPANAWLIFFKGSNRHIATRGTTRKKE
jgi:hypothetical protein